MLAELAGFAGSAAVLGTYGWTVARRSGHRVFAWGNVLGAPPLVWSSIAVGAWPAALVSAAFGMLGLWGLRPRRAGTGTDVEVPNGVLHVPEELTPPQVKELGDVWARWSGNWMSGPVRYRWFRPGNPATMYEQLRSPHSPCVSLPGDGRWEPCPADPSGDFDLVIDYWNDGGSYLYPASRENLR